MTVPRILVLYPTEFMCPAKFRRKLENILANTQGYELAYLDDPNGFIEAQRDVPTCRGVMRVNSTDGVTHAIIFDDGEVFAEALKTLQTDNVVVRLVKIKITRVINIRRDERFAGKRSTPSYEYIGRGSDWGNPYSMFEGPDEGMSSRSEVIRKYAYDFDRGLLKRSKVDALELAGKRLGCFCKPEACHGDVIANYLNSLDDGQ